MMANRQFIAVIRDPESVSFKNWMRIRKIRELVSVNRWSCCYCCLVASADLGATADLVATAGLGATADLVATAGLGATAGLVASADLGATAGLVATANLGASAILGATAGLGATLEGKRTEDTLFS
jgi:hypothetical protein